MAYVDMQQWEVTCGGKIGVVVLQQGLKDASTNSSGMLPTATAAAAATCRRSQPLVNARMLEAFIEVLQTVMATCVQDAEIMLVHAIEWSYRV